VTVIVNNKCFEIKTYRYELLHKTWNVHFKLNYVDINDHYAL